MPRKHYAGQKGRTPAELAEIREKQTERVEKATADIVRLFESDELPAAIARATIRRLEHDAPIGAWSLSNQLIALMHGTDDARGFQQWKAVGRSVKPGERAFHILGPRIVKRTETDPDTGQKTERKALVGFVTIPVFGLEQTEGAELEPPPDYTPAELPPLIEVAESFGLTIRYAPFAKNYYGSYSPGSQRIMLATHDAQVFFHELAHAAHDRILRANGKALQGGQHRDQEVIAEVSAAALARLYDLELEGVSRARDYVQHYAKDTTPAKAAMKVLATVQAVLSLILTTSESLEATPELEAEAVPA